ncbi:MAG: peptide chain release factor 2 [Nitrospinota bacterium]
MNCEVVFDLDGLERERERLDREAVAPDFWAEPERAQELLRQRAKLSEPLDRWSSLHQRLVSQREMLDLLREEEEPQLLAEVERELDALEGELERLEFQLIMSDEADPQNAIVSINAGAGGIEGQDWAEMLLRMYLRWAETRAFRPRILDRQGGEEAGIKSATFVVEGEYAYGYLRSESGVHRLVRISPFDASARRHTSFASVFVFPEVEDEIEVEIPDADLRVDTFRASGHGGQHVNVTDSAVRLTHLPSGTVVVCQNERSQHKNKAQALKVLRSRLYELERRKREEKMEEIHSAKKQIAFGNQIRSYVLQPYRLVKDHRTEVETSNVEAVLDGDLDAFIRAYLLSQIHAG